MKTEKDVLQIEELQDKAEQIADETIRGINKTVPASVPAMVYARQWVLEETIKILQAKV